MNTSPKQINELYPENITTYQETILARLYKIQQDLKIVYDYQSKIHPILHKQGIANDHADIWRKIESMQSLLKPTIPMIKNEFS